MAIVMATIVQNSGRILQQPYYMRIAVRLSPIQCALDITMVSVELISLLYAGCTLKVAAHHVWLNRFPPEDFDKSASRADSPWPLSMTAFSLGALSQMVKTYAVRGIPLTQAMATIYLVSFVQIELIRLVSDPMEHEDLPSMLVYRIAQQRMNTRFVQQRITRLASSVARIGNVCDSIILTVIFGQVQSHIDMLFMGSIYTSSILILSGVALFALRRSKKFLSRSPSLAGWDFDEEQRGISTAGVNTIHTGVLTGLLLFACSIVAVGELMFFVNRSSPSLPDQDEILWDSFKKLFLVCAGLISWAAITVIVMLGHYLVCIVLWLLSTRRMAAFKTQNEKGTQTALLFVTLSLNTCGWFLYYCILFSSEGTWKPAWTNLLG